MIITKIIVTAALSAVCVTTLKSVTTPHDALSIACVLGILAAISYVLSV